MKNVNKFTATTQLQGQLLQRIFTLKQEAEATECQYVDEVIELEQVIVKLTLENHRLTNEVSRLTHQLKGEGVTV